VDVLSQREVTLDYELKQGVLDRALRTLRVVPIDDLFAYTRNRKLARFVAMDGLLAVGALTTDAFALSWKNERPYAFPPVQVVSQVLQKIQEEEIMAIVVGPRWTSQPRWLPSERSNSLQSNDRG
jgi:hypothetical protein